MKGFYRSEIFPGGENLVVQHETDRGCEPHTHDFFEFVLVVRGEAEHIVDGKSYRTRPGSVAFINFGQTHEVVSDETEYYNVLITPDCIGSGLYRETETMRELFSFVYERGDGDQYVNFTGADVTRAITLVGELYRETTEKRESWEAAASDLFHLFLIMLLRYVRGGKTVAPQSKIDEVLGWLRAHYAENPSLSEVSERFYYNDSYFSRLFKRFTGEGFNAYVNSLKIGEAAELLENTSLSVEAIAEKVGYADVKTFYTQFRKITGTTPGAFRPKK